MFFLEYAVDILFLIVSIVIIAVFAKRGFIDSLFRYGKSIVAAIASFTFGPALGDIIFDNLVFSRINDWIVEKSNSALSSVSGAVDVDQLISEMPFLVRQFVLSERIRLEYGETVDGIGESVTRFAELVATPIANVVSNLLAYIIVFVCALLVLWLLRKLLDLITTLPVLNGVNRVLGALLGAFASFVLLSLVTCAVSLLISVVDDAGILGTMVESSYLFGFFSKISIFNLF